MYNTEVKARYIAERNETTVLPYNFLNRIFSKSETFEEQLKKDLYDFTFYEIENYYKTLNIEAIDYLYVLNNAYILYVQWCLQENLVADCQNHFLEFNKEKLMAYINKITSTRRIVSRKQVISWCEELPNASDQFVLLGTFEGLYNPNYSDFRHAKIEDIEGNTIRLISGREIQISDKLIEYAKECNDAMEYYSITNNMTKKMPFKSSPTIIKEYPNIKEDVNEHQKGIRIYNKLARSFKYLGVYDWMKANALIESGMIHMINERAKQLNITGKQYLYSDYIKELEKQYSKNIIRSQFYLKIKDFLV